MVIKQKLSGDTCFKYLRTQLNKSGKSLSNYLAKVILENGNVYSFVPEGVSQNDLYQFDSGGLYPTGNKILINGGALEPIQNDARVLVVELIYKYLTMNESNCCIFEEPVAFPSDSWVKKSRIEYVHINNEMFYFFDNKTNDIEKINTAFKTSESYYSLCVFSTCNMITQTKFRPFEEIATESLKDLIDNLTFFIVKAYDGEGYIMWEK